MLNFVNAKGDDIPSGDADLRFQRLVREPRIAITLMTAVLLTAIVWITTFLATVSSAAAYLAQVGAAPAVEEPLRHLTTPRSLQMTALTMAAAHPRDVPGDESLDTSPATGQSRAAEKITNVRTPPAVAPEQSRPVSPPARENPDVRGDSATVLAQDQSSGGEQLVLQEKTVARNESAEKPCAEGFWGGVCRERMRWRNCHPDKWDVTPECAVQKFSSYNPQ